MSRRRMLPLIVAVVAAVGGSSHLLMAQASPQGSNAADNAPGTWLRLAPLENVDPVVTRSARVAIAPKLQELLAILRTSPTLATPRGFRVEPSISAEPGPYWEEDRDAPDYAHGPLRGGVSIVLDPFVADESTGAIRPAGEGPIFSMHTNDARCLYPGWKEPYASDSLGPMYVEPTRVDDVHGHPAYLGVLDQPCVVITSRRQPLFVPVSNARLLRALIANDRATMAGVVSADDNITDMLRTAREMKSSPNAEMRKQAAEMERRILEARASRDSVTGGAAALVRRRLASHERLLASMTPEQRNAPAVVRNFAMADDPFSSSPDMQQFAPTAIVAPNRAFFDRTRPIADTQLLTFYTVCRQASCSGWGNAMRGKFLEEIDWGKLEGLVR